MSRPQAPKQCFDNGERNRIESGFSSPALAIDESRFGLGGAVEAVRETAQEFVEYLGGAAATTL